MSQRWFYQLFGEEFGPVSEAELRQLVDDGTISGDDLVRSAADSKWSPLAQVLGDSAGADAAGEATDEISDLSELNFEFEGSGPTSRRQAYDDESDRISDLSELNFEFEESAQVRRSQAMFGDRPDSPAAADDAVIYSSAGPIPDWFCQSLGQTLGPMTMVELCNMAESGALAADDLVRRGDAGQWRPVASVPELAAQLPEFSADELSSAGMSAATLKKIAPNSDEERKPGQESEPERDSSATDANQTKEAKRNRPDDSSSGQKTSEKNGDGGASPGRTGDSSAGRRSKNADGSGKVRKGKGRKKDDAILEEIFDEVFTDEPAPPRRAGSPRSLSDTSAGSDTDPAIPRTAAAEAASPSYTAPPAPVSSPSAAAGRTAAAMVSAARAPVSAPSRSSSRGSSFSMPNPKVLAVVVAVLAIAGYLWQFGLPITLIHYSASQYPERLKLAVSEYKAIEGSLTQDTWNSYAVKRRGEFKAQYDTLLASGGVDEKAKAMMVATKHAVSFVAADFAAVDYRKKNFEKLEKAVSALGP